ncbi:MAG: hypothetical protein DRG32_02795 [Deltaproteobacteria bacterium]|nr:MAG: hypothetical protein DRG32_02795 [Deltaproteobacteria bacterium]
MGPGELGELVHMIAVRPPHGFMSRRGRRDVSAQAAQKKEGVMKEGGEMTRQGTRFHGITGD